MSYTCEVSDNLLILKKNVVIRFFFSVIVILGAIISFITGAFFGIIVNWVSDFFQSIFH